MTPEGNIGRLTNAGKLSLKGENRGNRIPRRKKPMRTNQRAKPLKGKGMVFAMEKKKGLKPGMPSGTGRREKKI